MIEPAVLESRQLANQITIALAGNPNAGKTTLFNALTGMRQKVGSYPGVTVERKEGVWVLDGFSANVVDLPGLYSLETVAVDEEIARKIITGEQRDVLKPSVIIAVVDATNLERNLYLVTQIFGYGIPLVIALTMIDAFEKDGHALNAARLAERMHAPVVKVNAKTGRGLAELASAVEGADRNGCDSSLELQNLSGNGTQAAIFARYKFISDVVQETVGYYDGGRSHASEKIDRILTHRFFGLIRASSIV